MGVLLVGLMSGTSLDGIDAALVDFSAERPRTLAAVCHPYPPQLREEAMALQASGVNELDRAARFANELARTYADATAAVLATAGVSAKDVRAIGCHGQTVRHQPAAGYSIQLNSPALLAEQTGITVVADFRSRDIAAGGQGAPLVPAFHSAVFGHAVTPRAILNLGGIANLTYLRPGHAVTGFDCGPANLLMDGWIERHEGLTYDVEGAWAEGGHVLPELLADLAADQFFSVSPPKSCGRDEFNLAWLDRSLKGSERPQDVQATLMELTASTVADALSRWCAEAEELFVCGGGAHNTALMARLATKLPNRRVASTDSLGLSPDWVEAVAFAWLAWQALEGKPGNLPAVTGARGARVLGAIYPA